MTALQAKLHVALDLGEAGGDQGYTFGEGPVAARGSKPSSGSRDGPTKEIEMQGLGDDSAGQPEDDSSLQHNAAQVKLPVMASRSILSHRVLLRL